MTTENELFVEYLGAQRRHVLTAVDGLDDDALNRAMLPSGWTFAELVHHLHQDAEVFWLQGVVAGDAAIEQRLDPDSWTVPAGVAPSAVIETYRASFATSDANVAAVDLDAPPLWLPDYFADSFASTRDVLLHVVAEMAAHAGHADAARELLDGAQWRIVG